MEIADIFVVNKADRDGADRTVTAVESNLALQSYGEGEWRPPIVKTEATTGRGVPELWEAIKAFRAHSESSRVRRLKTRSEFRMRELLTHGFLEHLDRHVLAPGELQQLIERIAARDTDPYTAAADILKRALR
jgi:LAO/AO transport system kinase